MTVKSDAMSMGSHAPLKNDFLVLLRARTSIAFGPRLGAWFEAMTPQETALTGHVRCQYGFVRSKRSDGFAVYLE